MGRVGRRRERTKRERERECIYSGWMPRWILANRDNAAISKLPLRVSDIFIRLIIRVETRRYPSSTKLSQTGRIISSIRYPRGLCEDRLGPQLSSLHCSPRDTVVDPLADSRSPNILNLLNHVWCVELCQRNDRERTPWHREHCETNRTIRPAVSRIGIIRSFVHILLSIGDIKNGDECSF